MRIINTSGDTLHFVSFLNKLILVLLSVFIISACENDNSNADINIQANPVPVVTEKLETPAKKQHTLVQITDMSSVVETGMALWHVPGMSVAIVSSDSVEFQQGFGKTAIVEGKVVDEHTLFAIASTTKAMVVSGILMLVDEGKLSLDDAVIKHIPELNFKDSSLTQQITIRDILAHRTGLPSTDVWTFFYNMPLKEQIQRLQTVEPQAAVRTRLIYQNTMYEIAGLIIKRVSGKNWYEFLDERLWQPLGMNETYASRGQITKDKTFVLPHHYIDGEIFQSEWSLDKDVKDAAGSVWSSIHDMSLWAQFLLRGAKTSDGQQLISEKSFKQMFEPHQLATKNDFYPTIKLTNPNWRSYGLAWFQQDFQGRKINFHTGSLGGLIAIIGLDFSHDKAVVVLGNRDHAEMRHALLWHVMDTREANLKRDWNQDIFELYEESRKKNLTSQKQQEKTRLKDTQPSLPLKSFAGNYTNKIIGDINIRDSDRGLQLILGTKSFVLNHWHLNSFTFTKREWQSLAFLEFRIGQNGKVKSIDMFGEEFTRIPEKSKATKTK